MAHLLITGGASSGKSRYALSRARTIEGPRAFIATAQALDEEMTRKIARHQSEREPDWRLTEEPLDLSGALRLASREARVVVVDCLTLWTSNVLCGENIERLQDRLETAVEALKTVLCPVILVTNEVGMGLVPDTPLGRAFREAQGLVNGRVGEICEEIQLLVSGCPLTVKKKKEI